MTVLEPSYAADSRRGVWRKSASGQFHRLPSIPLLSFSQADSSRSPRGTGISRHIPCIPKSVRYLLFILATGTFLRFFHLGTKGLWGDEIWTAEWSRPGILHIFSHLSRPPDMPLMYALTHISLFFGQNEFWVRLPSALFGILGIYLIYLVSRLMTRKKEVALVSSYMLAISPFHIWYSQEARYYSIWIALTLAASFYLLVALDEMTRIYPWVAFAVIAVLSIYTHLLSLWIVLSLLLFSSLVFIHDNIKAKRSCCAPSVTREGILLAASFLGMLCLSVPAIISVVRTLRTGVSPTGQALASFTLVPKIPVFLNKKFLWNFIIYLNGGKTLSYILVPLSALGMLSLWKRRPRVLLLAVTIFITPILVSFFIDFLHFINYRYFIFMLPFYLIIVAEGIATIPGILKRFVWPSLNERSLIAITILIVSALSVTPLNLLYRQGKANDWRAIASYIGSHAKPGAVVLTEKWGAPALKHYLHRRDIKILMAKNANEQTLGGRDSWFVGLRGKYEKDIREQGFVQVPERAWKDSRFFYYPEPNAEIVYPISEPFATVYRKTSSRRVQKGAKTVAPKSVWIIGDSLTTGLFASSDATSFRSILLRALGNEFPGSIHSTFWGNTCSLGGLAQKWDEWDDYPDVLFIELGINDLPPGRPKCVNTPEKEWKARYGATLDHIRARDPGVEIVIGTIPWCNWKRGSKGYEKAMEYNAWIIELAADRGIPVADLWSATFDRRDGISSPDKASPFAPFLHGDNFHPSDVGHRRIAQEFFRTYINAYHHK